jgi:hypothetical protein
MHIVFIGYGKTSQRVAKQLFAQGHQISTISRSPKTDPFAQHYVQDVHHLDLSTFAPIDWVYVLLSPEQSSVEGISTLMWIRLPRLWQRYARILSKRSSSCLQRGFMVKMQGR